MSAAANASDAGRVPCASCKGAILEGARKCKFCKAWQPERARAPRAAIIVAAATLSVFSVIVTSQKSIVADAPPLTALAGESASVSDPPPAGLGPDPVPVATPPTSERRKWSAREIRMGDVHPLDLVFSADGESLFVSADDATLREYRVATGEIVHKTSVPAKGDELRLLFDRYVAVLRRDPLVARIPVMDITRWDKDPVELEVGRGPKDVLEMPDGTVVSATNSAHRVSRFALPSGKLVGDITLAQATGQVFLVRAEGRPYLAALGSVTHAGRPAGAWVDIFDPAETPFGATRRSIPVGRDPRFGSVTAAGSAIFFPDYASNTATLLDVGEETRVRTVDVGQGPSFGFVLAGDRYGVTLDTLARTATLVRLDRATDTGTMEISTLMLDGEPRDAALSPDGTTLFVALGGQEEVPRGQGVAILGGDPPSIIATLPTGAGAMSVAVAKNGARAAVANYLSKSITIVE